jgi:hypothetical protein
MKALCIPLGSRFFASVFVNNQREIVVFGADGNAGGETDR